MDKDTILAKPEAERTAEEIAFLAENKEDTMSEDDAKNLVGEAAEKAMTKAIEKLSDGLLAKFMDGVKEARKTALETGEEKGKGQEATRKFMKALMSGDKVGAKAISTTTGGVDPDDSNAGVLVPVELKNEVLRIAQTQFGLARRDMFYLPFSGPGNTRTVPTLGTSVSVFWTGEGKKKRSTQPSFSLVTQTLKKLAAIVPMTEEILEDSLIDINALLGQLFAEAIAKEEDVQFFMGTGTPWTGILNNGSVNQVTQASGDASQLTVDDLIDMEDATPTGALNGAKYYFHRSIKSVLKKLKDQNGNYILVAASNGSPATLNGYPYECSDAFPALNDIQTGDAYVLFGNLKQGAIFGDKQQIRVKLLDQATVGDTDGAESGSDEQTSINLAEEDMVALRIVERVGYTIALAKALTVLKAAAHES